MRIDENTDIDGTRTVVEHHGDGTGTRTVYDADGNIVEGPTAVDGLPVEVEAPPDQDVPTAAAVGAVPREPVVTTVGATGATETLTIDGSVDAYVLTMDEACAVTPTGGVEGVTVLVWVSGAFTLSWVGVTVDSGTVPDYVSGSLYAITYLAGAYRLALIGSGFAAP